MTNIETTIVIPTIGNKNLKQCVQSALSQTIKSKVYIVVDGKEHKRAVDIISEYVDDVNICILPENVGRNGFYGHRTIAAFSHLVNTPYVYFIDEDNFLQPEHIEECINTIKSNKDLQFVYSLRSIYDDDKIICNDECESIGKLDYVHGSPRMGHHVDTSAYFYKTNFIKQYGHYWHYGYGADRRFYRICLELGIEHECTYKYTLVYRLGGNENSVKADFFINGNKLIKNVRSDNESYSIFV